jgi:oligopeptide transport system permease protein
VAALKRLLLAVPVVWGAVSLVFLIFFVLPGDRVDAVLDSNRSASPLVRAHIAHQLGLDRPLVDQYGRYWAHLFHGDLGVSVYGQSVSSIIHSAAPASLRLAFWALLLELVVGIGAGTISTICPGRFARAWNSVWTALLLAAPVFVIGYLLQLALAVHPYQAAWPQWLRFPAEGIGPNHWWLGVFPAANEWRYLLLPTLTLAFVSTAVIARLTRSSLVKSLDSDFVTGARARGIPQRQILIRHALRTALIPVVTYAGLDVVNLFGSAVITESLFNWPGIGNATGFALAHEDAQVLLGVTVLLAVVYVGVNLIVDATYRFLDPRIRAAK